MFTIAGGIILAVIFLAFLPILIRGVGMAIGAVAVLVMGAWLAIAITPVLPVFAGALAGGWALTKVPEHRQTLAAWGMIFGVALLLTAFRVF